MPAPSVILANTVNPALLFLLLLAPFLTTREIGRWEYWVRSGLGIGLAVILTESGKHFQVWHGDPNFPSGHETLGLATATCLILRDIRWLGIALPLTGLLAWALVTTGYHKPVEVAGALLVGPPTALLCQLPNRKNPS